MLSPHEFATLMLVKDSVEQIADRDELDALLERQLLDMEQLAGSAVLPRVTQDGDSVLMKRVGNFILARDAIVIAKDGIPPRTRELA